jgi:uncharacterized membrane protein YdfJ with MMPL/SSD domain
MRRPATWAISATAALVLLALPAFGLHTNRGGLDVMPADTPELAALHVLEKAYPGGIDPARLVIKAPDVTAPDVRSALDELEQSALRAGVINRGIAVETNTTRTIARVDVPIVGTGPDEQSKRALATLRTTIVPNTIGKVANAEYAVGGTTAASVDYTDAMKRSLPLVFLFVLGFAFLLLIASFRSLTIALASIAMNLLSSQPRMASSSWSSRRPGRRRGPPRRNTRSRRLAAQRDEAARRSRLVPALLAHVAAPHQARPQRRSPEHRALTGALIAT